MKTRCALSLLGLGAGMGIAGAAYAQSHTYSVTDLGTLSNTPNNNGCGAQVTGINNQGQVVGSYFVDTQSYGGIARGFLWNNGKLSQVGAAYNPNQKLTIVAINNQGDMAGNISAGCYPGLGDYSIHQLFLGKHKRLPN
jgi:probable HAF family extracellular repeat protein